MASVSWKVTISNAADLGFARTIFEGDKGAASKAARDYMKTNPPTSDQSSVFIRPYANGVSDSRKEIVRYYAKMDRKPNGVPKKDTTGTSTVSASPYVFMAKMKWVKSTPDPGGY